MKIARITTGLLLLIIVAKLGLVFWQAPGQSTDLEQLRQLWLHSQYNLNQGYEFYGNMTDEDLHTLSAIEYVRGTDPTTINFEQSPLGKYLLGFSYLVFGNVLIVQYIASALAVYLTYLLARKVSIPSPFSFIPSLILVFDPLFIERSTSVNLDLLQLVFVLFSILLLVQSGYNRRSFLLLGAAVGSALASKIIFIGLLLLLFVIFVLSIKPVPQFKTALFLVVGGCFFVYLLSYVVFFVYHPPVDFILLHIRIARIYRSYLPEYPWFEIWRILLLGQWRTWFAQPPIQPVTEFWIAWPLSTLATGSLIFSKNIWRMPFKPRAILLGWTIIYLLFQSIHVVFPRYLLTVLPFLYILSVFSLRQWFRSN
jgi:hypothetical protein